MVNGTVVILEHNQQVMKEPVSWTNQQVCETFLSLLCTTTPSAYKAAG